MTETMTGHVTNMTSETRGDELAVAVTLGATSLTVVDAVDFDETGGSFLYGGVVHTYTAADMETDVLSGISPTLAAGAIGDRVDVWSPGRNDVVADWVAAISDGIGGDIECPVSEALVDRLGGGIRGLTGESVVCTLEAGEWTVSGIVGNQQPVSTGAVLQTNDTGQRIVIRGDSSAGIIEGWSGLSDETAPAKFDPSANSGRPALLLKPGASTTYNTTPSILLVAGSGTNEYATFNIQDSTFTGELTVVDDLIVGGVVYRDNQFSQRSRTSAQTISDSTWESVNFNDDQGSDNDGTITWGSNQWTVESDVYGLYAIDASVRFTTGGATGKRGIRILKGSTVLAQQLVPSATGDISLCISAKYYVSSTDPTFKVEVFQSSGGSADIASDARGSVIRIG